MRTTILIKENRTQLVLHSDTPHDEDVIEILTKLPNTHRVSLYDRQGGWTAFGTEYYNGNNNGEDLMIVFDTGVGEDTATLLPQQRTRKGKGSGVNRREDDDK